MADPPQRARPVGRSVAPGAGAGRRGFAVLFVAGVAINVWALFPSAVESGVLIALPDGATKPDIAKPAVADAESGAIGGPRDPLRGMAFRLMEFDPVSAHPTTYSVPYPGVAVGVGAVPLRSKLLALLLLLSARYGDNVDATALELKLQALLRLPDSVLAQLMRHPDLANLNTLLDGMFLAAPDLSVVKTEFDKITVNSTAGPTERVDVVTVNGEPAYVVHSPLAENTTDGIAAARLSAPAEMATFSVVVSIDPSIPEPEPTAAISTEFSTPPSVTPTEPSLLVETSPPEPVSVTPPPVDMGPVDIEVEDETEPVEMDDDDRSTGQLSDPSGVPVDEPSNDGPADTPGPSADSGGSVDDAADSSGDGAQGEMNP